MRRISLVWWLMACPPLTLRDNICLFGIRWRRVRFCNSTWWWSAHEHIDQRVHETRCNGKLFMSGYRFESYRNQRRKTCMYVSSHWLHEEYISVSNIVFDVLANWCVLRNPYAVSQRWFANENYSEIGGIVSSTYHWFDISVAAERVATINDKGCERDESIVAYRIGDFLSYGDDLRIYPRKTIGTASPKNVQHLYSWTCASKYMNSIWTL